MKQYFTQEYAEVNHWIKHEFQGYPDWTSDTSNWTEPEHRVNEWLEQYEGKGQFHFDGSFGIWRFEYEEDYMVFLLKFGKDISKV